MRTLATLRDSCIDGNTELTIPLKSSSHTPFTATTLTYVFDGGSTLITSGFYVLTFEMRFVYANTGVVDGSTPSIVGSNVHNRLFYQYTYKEDNGNTTTLGGDLVLTNSFETLSQNFFRWAGKVVVNIKKNSTDFKIGFQTVEHPNIPTLPKVSFDPLCSLQLDKIF
jgi:hypothetical protein